MIVFSFEPGNLLALTLALLRCTVCVVKVFHKFYRIRTDLFFNFHTVPCYFCHCHFSCGWNFGNTTIKSGLHPYIIVYPISIESVSPTMCFASTVDLTVRRTDRINFIRLFPIMSVATLLKGLHLRWNCGKNQVYSLCQSILWAGFYWICSVCRISYLLYGDIWLECILDWSCGMSVWSFFSDAPGSYIQDVSSWMAVYMYACVAGCHRDILVVSGIKGVVVTVLPFRDGNDSTQVPVDK